jgi:hypothetical protein
MQIPLLILLTGLSVLNLGNPENSQPPVPVVKADMVDSFALKQVTTASPDLGIKIPVPVASLWRGLTYAQKAANRPILAMSESNGWFFYATSVARDDKTGEPRFLISGYAIKRGGRRVIHWSVW